MPGSLVIVTGLPAAGKSLLAAELARTLGLPLLAKDAIKEPLLDMLGAGDALHSRRLSDASFALQFLLAGELILAGHSAILEGNFRPGEHEAPLALLLSGGTRVAQVLCRIEEPLRLARLRRRLQDGSRHPGHPDAALVPLPLDGDDFLDLPGPHWVHRGQAPRRERRATAQELADWLRQGGEAISPAPE